jgi:hypothetical protein
MRFSKNIGKIPKQQRVMAPLTLKAPFRSVIISEAAGITNEETSIWH